MLSIIFYQSQHYQPIVEKSNISILHIFLANTAVGLVYGLRFRGRLVDDFRSLFREI